MQCDDTFKSVWFPKRRLPESMPEGITIPKVCSVELDKAKFVHKNFNCRVGKSYTACSKCGKRMRVTVGDNPDLKVLEDIRCLVCAYPEQHGDYPWFLERSQYIIPNKAQQNF